MSRLVRCHCKSIYYTSYHSSLEVVYLVCDYHDMSMATWCSYSANKPGKHYIITYFGRLPVSHQICEVIFLVYVL